MSKLFFGFEISLAAQVYALERIDKVKHLAPKAEWVDAGKLHVTLLFLGDGGPGAEPLVWQPRVQHCGEALLSTPSFRCRVTSPALFSQSTLYLRVEGAEPLISARERIIRDVSGATRIARSAWTPHLTLAKGGPREDLVTAHALLLEDWHQETFTVGCVGLYKTESGQPYKKIQNYHLYAE